jgi:hypothetical protein
MTLPCPAAFLGGAHRCGVIGAAGRRLPQLESRRLQS